MAMLSSRPVAPQAITRCTRRRLSGRRAPQVEEAQSAPIVDLPAQKRPVQALGMLSLLPGSGRHVDHAYRQRNERGRIQHLTAQVK